MTASKTVKAEPRVILKAAEPEMARIEVKVNGVRSTFRVPSDLTLVRGVGAGTYGMVAAFQHTQNKSRVAVKKITNAFDDLIDGKRILREVRLLRSLEHENIVSILNMYAPEGPDFDDVYIVQELLEMDLQRVIRSQEVLSEEHQAWFAYQILKGISYMHSMDVVHRDLKPSNILVNRDCTLKICDFGLARGSVPSEPRSPGARRAGGMLTEYVVTRHYRAPEVVLLACEYGKEIDIWSVGCIFGELIARMPLFKGKDHLDQIRQILEVIGAQTGADLDWLGKGCDSARKFVAKFRDLKGRSWTAVLPGASAVATAAIGQMLSFNPSRRPTAQECMRLPVFSELFREKDICTDTEAVDWSFDQFEPTKRLLQNYLYCECARFNPQIVERDGSKLEERGITKVVLAGEYGFQSTDTKRRN